MRVHYAAMGPTAFQSTEVELALGITGSARGRQNFRRGGRGSETGQQRGAGENKITLAREFAVTRQTIYNFLAA